MSINLQKGQKISLKKEAGGELTKISMGLGWDVAQTGKKSGGFLSGIFGGGGGGETIDLDASCVLFDESKNPVDVVFFGKLKSDDGSIVHTGDNTTGDGDGDDEVINVDLSRVPANVKSLVFTVNSFTGQTFETVSNAFCRIVNTNNKNEVARYNLSSQGSHVAMIMAKVYRHNGEWKMHAIGETSAGRTIEEMMPHVTPHA